MGEGFKKRPDKKLRRPREKKKEATSTKSEQTSLQNNKKKLHAINEELVKKATRYGEEYQWNLSIDSFKKAYQKVDIEEKLQIGIGFSEKGALLANSGNNLDAAISFAQAIGCETNDTSAYRNLGIVLKRLGCMNDAKKIILTYLNVRPKCPLGLNTLATIDSSLGLNAEAIIHLKEAIKLDPNYAEAYCNLSNEYHLISDLDNAYGCSSKSISLNPNPIGMWADHFTQIRRVCDFDKAEAINWWKIFNKLTPEAITFSLLQLLVLTKTEAEAKKLMHLQLLIQEKYKSLSASSQYIKRTVNPKERLRIGFISADFRSHSVARFIWPIFNAYDRNKYSYYCYSSYKQIDSWRARFEQASDAMRDIEGLSPQALQNLIQGDKIDILFDLTGYTKGSRTHCLAWRSAPIQISWLGFPGSAGIHTIDYLLVDKYLCPDDHSLLIEKPLIKPGSTVCFAGMDNIPTTKVLPEQKRGYITYGTLNNSYKLSRDIIRLWARVLNADPNSKFLFVRREFESFFLRSNILKEFESQGTDSRRIHFFNNRKAKRHYLDCYNEIDITLDTYPVTGGTTTVDSLWMGVPVICFEGKMVHQRVCSSILKHAGLDQWVCKSEQEYIHKAVELAKNRESRFTYRSELRNRLKHSALCDTDQFVRDFEQILEKLKAKLIEAN